MAESLNGTYKAEPIRRSGPWKTRHQAEFATIKWIDWHNTTRLHVEISHIPPLERDANWNASNIGHHGHQPINLTASNPGWFNSHLAEVPSATGPVKYQRLRNQ